MQMTTLPLRRACFALILVLAAAPVVSADFVQFDFQGNAGFGLLPDNEVGDGTSVGSGSAAIGGEIVTGVVYDTDSQILSLVFEFEGLTRHKYIFIHLHD